MYRKHLKFHYFGIINFIFKFEKLTEQYRFNSEINELASNLVYDGKMKPHKFGKGNKRLVDEVGEWKTKTSVDGWLRKVIDPETSVTWLDTSKVRNLETKMTSGYTNTAELQECYKRSTFFPDLVATFDD